MALIAWYTDLSSPEVVAAQGALVSVGSSYVTYIDKKGQVRCFSFGFACMLNIENHCFAYVHCFVSIAIYSAQNQMKSTY